jgi:hypothetical protein
MPAGLFKLVFRPLNPDAAEDKIRQQRSGSAPHAANTLASFKTDCKGALYGKAANKNLWRQVPGLP